MKRARSALFAVLFWPLLLHGCAHLPALPNVILVVVDTLRADYLGAYGFEGSVSPNIDALARESVVFEHCSSQAPWTKPATASLLTSLYPMVHGVMNYPYGQTAEEWRESREETRVLADRAVTIAEAFDQAGYHTGAFVANPWVGRGYGFAQGFDHFDDHTPRSIAVASLLIDRATTWLETLPGGEPFFLYIHFMDVHPPFNAPEEDYEAVVGSASLGGDRELADGDAPHKDPRWNSIEHAPPWATEEQRHRLQYWRARYASGVRQFDEEFDRFLRYLTDSGRMADSYVALTSDHGEELFEHGDWSHGLSLYEHQLHVPLLIRLPNAEGGGRRVSEPVRSIDIMPTLLASAGVEVPKEAQGQDVSSCLRGECVDSEHVSLATGTTTTPELYSLRTPTYKLVLDLGTGDAKLYDLVRDPNEQTDIASVESETTKKLVDLLLADLNAAVSKGTLDGGFAEIPADMAEQLRRLGY